MVSVFLFSFAAFNACFLKLIKQCPVYTDLLMHFYYRLYQLYNYNNSKTNSNNSKLRLSGFDSNSACSFTAIEVVGGDGYYNNL